MKVHGVMAINRFPYWEKCLRELMKHCDKVFIRFDGRTGDPDVLNQIAVVCGDKLGQCLVRNGWSFPEWREDCLRIASAENPDIILCPDQDEIFGEGFADELRAFASSDKKAMMFNYYPLESSDGRVINRGQPYPKKPHMKAFKWEQGLSYYPYHGDAKISRYFPKSCHWNANTKIRHLPCFTPIMEAMKLPNLRDGKGSVKAVTMIGFGPSSKVKMKAQGEVWSLNNCYDALRANAMKLCTRIFEMHQLEKRRGAEDVGNDGKPHLWHLDQEGKKGRRIILLKQDENITNSESFPLAEVEAGTGIKTQWRGTPCYMLAMAIVEGYTHIRLFGLDQMDWEHTLQREAFLFWLGYAIGRGIQISGCPTALERNMDVLGRYGYDYGPEFDEKQERAIWDGWPFEISMKIPSRVVAGDLYRGNK